MSLPPSLYRYSSLPEGSIRLLRLLPHQDEHAPIQCQLFDCALADSGSTRPYEALSYVWGSEIKPRSLSIDSCDLPVGENLYAALSNLRDCSIERTVWADAVCINQRDPKEKGKQVQSMAKIYAKASGVIVWLGEATPDSGKALEKIRMATQQRMKLPLNERAIIRLLERSWFQRIWVLQEVAAARHVLIKCGPTGIDGYAFCSGLSALNLSYETHPDLRPLIRSVAYLIRGAAFRPRCATGRLGRFSLDICSLGELIEMYHTHKATDRRDKVYALLGMSSDDPSIAGLSANYEISWGQLFQQLVNFFFSKRASVDTWDDKEMALIRGKGCIMGRVYSVERDIGREDRQHVIVKWRNELGYGRKGSRWTFQASAKSVQVGDAVCLLEGASMPTIIRLCGDCWAVVMIAVPPPDYLHAASRNIKQKLLRLAASFPHDFVLFWDWDMYPDESLGRKDYEHFMGTLMAKCPKADLGDCLNKVLRLRDIGVVLQDMRSDGEARKIFRKAMETFESALRSMDCPGLACPCHGRWGKEDIEKLEDMAGQLIKEKDGWMPLWLATETGCETIVKAVLSTGKVDPGAKGGFNERTPLLLAVEKGPKAVIKLLRDAGKVDPDAKERFDGWTPLSLAAENGQETIVKLLLDTGKVDPDAKGGFNEQTPLSLAAENGHETIVKLLLDTGKVDLEAKERLEGRTPLLLAKMKGHEAIVKLLLNAEDRHK
ncbi:hypothetical protein LCI18_013089 [Fusarium solani-melongenae]|uniref:Uncharacterized protein n=1 Tax=Fusarium solani subsp. cucurbitae TaxID=2747967 RepID=A0ACD3ZLK1_FUSSC|nr:hypothetical protein LCI18_013089 [Fusarium solani-melongenae]